MLFCSQEFLLFFVAIFAVYWLLPWRQPRVWLLLVASFYFYASWNKWLATLICITTLMDYLVALGMDHYRETWKRKGLLILSLIINLGFLCYFKYANFFLQSLEDAVHAAGGSASLPWLKVILPVGISFYTFEAINYTVDVYRRKAPAERNLGHFMLFILFFPHLIAGPIVRARDFLPQIARPKRFSWLRMQLGVQFFLMGMFKKMAIADRMALFADPVFADPGAYNTGAVWLAMLAYALQIYCDFSGYTDMALGTAHMLGYKLALNFNMPYSAANISDFWRRWHISLSSWLRDYLFIPLGGSRGSKWLNYRNLMITMTLGGLWHGASWTFVVWGILHGSYLIIHRLFADFCKTRPTVDAVAQSFPGRAVCIVLTFLCVCVGWVFFRAQSPLIVHGEPVLVGKEPMMTGDFQIAATFLKRLVVPSAGQGAPLHNRSLWVTVAIVVLCHFVGRLQLWKQVMTRLPEPALGFGYAAVLTLALVLAPDTGKAFIYFQF